MNPIYLFILSALLLLQSPRSVQSFSLSRLCAQFGHSCFGGKNFISYKDWILNKKYSIANWGKRAIPENLALNLKKKNNERVIDDHDDQMSNYVLDELRLVNKIVCIKNKIYIFFSLSLGIVSRTITTIIPTWLILDKTFIKRNHVRVILFVLKEYYLLYVPIWLTSFQNNDDLSSTSNIGSFTEE